MHFGPCTGRSPTSGHHAPPAPEAVLRTFPRSPSSPGVRDRRSAHSKEGGLFVKEKYRGQVKNSHGVGEGPWGIVNLPHHVEEDLGSLKRKIGEWGKSATLRNSLSQDPFLMGGPPLAPPTLPPPSLPPFSLSSAAVGPP